MEAEAKRCLDMDIKGFVLPDTPERLGLPSFLLSARDQRGQAPQPAIVNPHPPGKTHVSPAGSTFQITPNSPRCRSTSAARGVCSFRSPLDPTVENRPTSAWRELSQPG